MNFFSSISGIQSISTTWYLAEEYLSPGDCSYEAILDRTNLKNIRVIKRDQQPISLIKRISKIASCVLILPFLIALVVKAFFRTHYSIQVVQAESALDRPPQSTSSKQRGVTMSASARHPPQQGEPPTCFSPLAPSKHAPHNPTAAVRDKELSTLLSQVSLSLVGKKIVVFSKDLGGYGDFMFGQKTLSALDESFPGVQLVFATDSPEKCLQVKQNMFPLLLSEHTTASLEEVSLAIESEHPDLLIIAPVTNFNRAPFTSLLEKTRNVFIREYGWTDTLKVDGQFGDYVSGAGVDRSLTGIFISKDFVRWAESSASTQPLNRLAELKKTPEWLQKTILGRNSFEDFTSTNELFLAFGNNVSKIEFMIAVTEMLHELHSSKSLTFVLVGTESTQFLVDIEKFKGKFRTFGIDKILVQDPKLGCSEIDISQKQNHRIINCICATFSPSDLFCLIKASEKEILTTGDQSWGEAISAHKHWIQEDVIHKRSSLQNVVAVARGPLLALLKKASQPSQTFLVVNDQKAHAQKSLLYNARVNSSVSDQWRNLNSFISKQQDIQPWLKGLVVRKFLENDPQFEKLWEKTMIAQSLSDDERQIFLRTSQQIARDLHLSPLPRILHEGDFP